MAKKTEHTVPAFESFDDGFCKGWKPGGKLTLQQHAARATMRYIRSKAKPLGGLEHVSENYAMRTKNWSADETTRLLVGNEVIGGLGFSAMITREFDASLIEVNEICREQSLIIAIFRVPVLILRCEYEGGEVELQTIEGFYEMLKDKPFYELVMRLLNRERQAAYSLHNYDVDMENKKGGPADEFVKWVLDGRGKGELPPRARGEMQLIAEAIHGKDKQAALKKKPASQPSATKPKHKRVPSSSK